MKNKLFKIFAFITRPLLATKFSRFIGQFGIVKYLFKFFMVRLRPEMVEVEGHKIYLDPNDSLWLSIKNYEPYETEIVHNEIKSGYEILDIGANIGYYTLMFAKQAGDSGKVYAFEPEPNNFALLEKNIKVNNYKNIIAVKKAVSNENGTLKLYLSEVNKGDHRIYQTSTEARDFVEIEAITLNDYFRGKEHNISFIKMDIQGAEGKALEGMSDLLSENRDMKLLMEYSPFILIESGSDPKEVIEKLESHGFSFTYINKKTKKIEPTTKEFIFKNYTIENKDFTNLLCIKKKK